MAAVLSVCGLLAGCATQAGKPKMKLAVERASAPQSASFAGVVRDETGAPLPGVTVVLRDDVTAFEITTLTNSDGAFAFDSLSEGLYRVEVTLSGFDSTVAERVAMKQDQITRAQVTLSFGTTETILVGAIGLDTSSNTGLTTTFTEDFLKRIPF